MDNDNLPHFHNHVYGDFSKKLSKKNNEMFVFGSLLFCLKHLTFFSLLRKHDYCNDLS